jgi:hypothetical protein
MTFAPGVQAVTAPLATTDNAGFLRPGATLGVMGFTDELEQSPSSVSYYFNRLMAVKGFANPNLFTFSTFAGFFTVPPAGCFAVADDGKFNQMVSLTHGARQSICTANWLTSLESIGKTVFGYRTDWLLNGVPDLTGGKTITVKIDGVIIPAVAQNGATVWTYDPVANAVVFEPLFVPEPGQTLTIDYTVTCF